MGKPFVFELVVASDEIEKVRPELESFLARLGKLTDDMAVDRDEGGIQAIIGNVDEYDSIGMLTQEDAMISAYRQIAAETQAQEFNELADDLADKVVESES